MFSVPQEYQRLIVRPSVDRFLADPTAFDLCFAACIFLYHFRDVFAEHNDIRPDDARQLIEKKDIGINVVHAMSIAAKHVVVRNSRLGPYEPPRDCRRLQLLRRWSHYEQNNEQIFT